MTRRPAAGPAGHSLPELLVAAAVAATLASLAAPSLSALLLDGRRTAVANELMSTLMLARTEAAKRRSTVIVCGLADADGDGRVGPDERDCAGHDWSGGWMAAHWTDRDGNRAVDAGETEPLRYYVNEHPRLRIRAGNFLATPPVAPAGTALFRPFAERSANGTVTICDDRGAPAGRAVVVSPNGRSRILPATVCP